MQFTSMKTLPVLFIAFLLSALTARAQSDQESPPATVGKVSIAVYADADESLGYGEGVDSLVVGATVRLVHLPEDEVVATAVTGPDNPLLFESVPFGTYQFIVTFPSGFTVASDPFEVDEDSPQDLLVAIPVVNRDTMPRYTNLHVVSPVNLSGPAVSPFAP